MKVDGVFASDNIGDGASLTSGLGGLAGVRHGCSFLKVSFLLSFSLRLEKGIESAH